MLVVHVLRCRTHNSYSRVPSLSEPCKAMHFLQLLLSSVRTGARLGLYLDVFRGRPLPIPSSRPETLQTSLSVSLAIGLVLCPVAFFLLIAAFIHVARKRTLQFLGQLPTTLPNHGFDQRRTYFIKFLAWRGARFFPGVTPQTDRDEHFGRGSIPPPLPLYTPPIPPPAYVPSGFGLLSLSPTVLS
ncbi:hypothetical protein K439DRAFT_749027 [Ramaria rubella]|nr:hypothetical protein K439DRAFT_749027 [Ramaria rubella]